MNSDQQEITRLLQRWSDGDKLAFDEVFGRLYRELKQLAERHCRRERPDAALQPTALVNEAYLRLCGSEGGTWECRLQFFKLASRVMRNVLVEHFRSAKTQKRGGGRLFVTLDEQVSGLGPDIERAVDVERLEAALAALRKINPLHSQIVELRFYGGLTVDDVAEMLGLSRATVKREWHKARKWLYDEVASS